MSYVKALASLASSLVLWILPFGTCKLDTQCKALAKPIRLHLDRTSYTLMAKPTHFHCYWMVLPICRRIAWDLGLQPRYRRYQHLLHGCRKGILYMAL